jgi:glucokinase
MGSGPLAIGVDLGGTQLRAALIDRNGAVRNRKSVFTKAAGGPDVVLGQIEHLVGSVLQGVDGRDITGIGVSAPGPLDTRNGVALSIPTLAGFVDYPLAAALQKRLPFPVSLENDGISAAIGEWRFGAGRGFENVVYVTVSTGIGGGVIIDNRVLRGRLGMAGHIGHMILVPDGERCSCGNLGCFEAYASGSAFAARAMARAKHAATTLLGANGTAIDSPAVFSAARAGDALAQDLVGEEARILGTGFASLVHLFSPDVIVMGGGLSHEFDALYPAMSARLQECAMPAFKDVRIVRSELGENSGLVGAASLVHEKAENS